MSFLAMKSFECRDSLSRTGRGGVHSDLGTDWSLAGGKSADDLEEEAATKSPSLDYEASGVIQSLPGTLSEAVSMSDFATPAGSGSNWYGFWSIARDPAVNPFESTSGNGYILDGEYSLGAIWTITFAP